MRNTPLKDAVMRILPRVQMPAQYLGGELNSIVKDHARVRGKLCLAFPDAYTLGMSHHGLQVLYTIMNNDPQWACERAFTPWIDFEKELRQANLPLYSLETFTPLSQFDIVGFSLFSSLLPMALPPRFSVVRLIANWSPSSCVIPREPASSTEISASALARTRCVQVPGRLS